MKKCKVCGVMLDDQTDYCPQCGYCFTSGKTAEEQALSGSRLSYTVSDSNGMAETGRKHEDKKEIIRETPATKEESVTKEEPVIKEEPEKVIEKYEEPVKEEKPVKVEAPAKKEEPIREEKVHKENFREEVVRKNETYGAADEEVAYAQSSAADSGTKEKIALGLSAVALLEGIFALLISVGLGFGFFRVVFNVLFYIGGNAMGIIALALHMGRIKEKDTVSLVITAMSCLSILLNAVSGVLMAF